VHPAVKPPGRSHHACSVPRTRCTVPGTPDHASFSVAPGVRPLPGSPTTVFREPNGGRGCPGRLAVIHLPRAARARTARVILWHRAARDLRPLLGDRPPVLIRQGGQPVDWRLP
jgi:hypothetical protein